MFQTGLVSVTFRQKSVKEVTDLAARAGLTAIEWGGDIHVPHGDTEIAAMTGRLCRDAGVQIASYGSYYRLCTPQPEFEKVLGTAVALAAPVIRVWAGSHPSAQCGEEQRALLAQDARRIAAMAGKEGIQVAFEYHGGTLTDCPSSAGLLLEECPDCWFYWQPAVGASEQERLQGLDAVKNRLLNFHVFQWAPSGERLALSAGQEEWKTYFSRVSELGDGPHYAMLEFVRGDDEEQFLTDAQTLCTLLG